MSEPEPQTTDPEAEPAVAPVPDPEPDEGTEPEGEPAEPQEPPQEPEQEPDSQAVMEEIGKKLDALTKTVATRISSILGDAALDFEVCDLCSYWNTPGWRHSGHLPEDLRAQMAYLIGQRAPSDLKPDPHSKPCDTCDGEGFVDTRSKVSGQEALPCVECNGMGWLPTDEARRRALLPLANGPAQPSGFPSPADQAMHPEPVAEPPSVAELRQQGYLVVAPIQA